MPDRRKSAHPKTDQDMMRCVVDQKGDLVFISPALSWALGQGSATLLHRPLGAMIRIVAALDSKHQSLDLTEVQSGFYDVALLRQYAAVPHRAHAQSRLVVGGWLLALFVFAAALAIVAYLVIRWLWLHTQ